MNRNLAVFHEGRIAESADRSLGRVDDRELKLRAAGQGVTGKERFGWPHPMPGSRTGSGHL